MKEPTNSVRALRMRQGLKQIELAKLAGISGSMLSEIESGQKTPSVKAGYSDRS